MMVENDGRVSICKYPVIVIAGASGYIGNAVIPALLEKFPGAEIIALSRSQQASDDPRIVWKACDLFSLKSIEEAMPSKIDLTLYLVHSMGPTAHLDQGTFADYDLILADNFSRATKGRGLKQLIYLGGLIPQTQKLSLHLQSRLEVEETFAQFQLPVTVFRAGLILGGAGSSFQILLKLVKRLPIMLCPRWTQNLTTPVDLETVLRAIAAVSLELKHVGFTYDLAGCGPLTYLQMMQKTARCLGKKRFFFAVPFFTPTLSRLWVSLITNTSKDLVYPLIESLEHPMIARNSNLLFAENLQRKYPELLEKMSLKTRPGSRLFSFKVQQKSVRSVQRLPLPEGKDAVWVKEQYVQWLPKFVNPVIRVQKDGSTLVFLFRIPQLTLLQLNLNQERSNMDRQLFYIIKGLLVAENNRGRLEFRVVLNRKFVLAAIHDYRSSLPWFIYVFTQAKIHLFVMKAFGRFLAKKAQASGQQEPNKSC